MNANRGSYPRPISGYFERVARKRAQRGITAVEVLIVLAIVAVLATAAVPNFAAAIERHRTGTAANDLLHSLLLARAQSLASGNRVVMAPLSDNTWTAGWRVFADPNNNGELDAGERVFQVFEPRDAAMTIVGSARLVDNGVARVSFTSFGFPRAINGTAFADGSLTVSLGGSRRLVCLDAQGGARMRQDAC